MHHEFMHIRKTGGVYGGWFYSGPRTAGGGGVPAKATLKAFVRAITSSLGSIALGSLIVTILELLRTIMQVVAQNERNQGDVLRLVPAAKDTWNLLRKRGVDALVNDSLVGIVLTTGAYIVGLLTALFAYLYLRYTSPAYNANGAYTAPVILFGALIGLNVGLAVSSAIVCFFSITAGDENKLTYSIFLWGYQDAGVSTIFVGLGEDPYILQERSPALFAEIQRVYPQVIQPVGGV
ncbi:hypothetical protein QFC21_006518 [Naganishia friedmannii]|uniref:Uncharacterized protein n=1 Tax=Naganishia friedmannii TaxID=89922 RepID=A0ACC2V2F0_9TREE|nr:hypothetical protein QFC21_006518 [Naganishia friedmannii]